MLGTSAPTRMQEQGDSTHHDQTELSLNSWLGTSRQAAVLLMICGLFERGGHPFNGIHFKAAYLEYLAPLKEMLLLGLFDSITPTQLSFWRKVCDWPRMRLAEGPLPATLLGDGRVHFYITEYDVAMSLQRGTLQPAHGTRDVTLLGTLVEACRSHSWTMSAGLQHVPGRVCYYDGGGPVWRHAEGMLGGIRGFWRAGRLLQDAFWSDFVAVAPIDGAKTAAASNPCGSNQL